MTQNLACTRSAPLNRATLDGTFFTITVSPDSSCPARLRFGLPELERLILSWGVMKRSARALPAGHWIGALSMLLIVMTVLPSTARAGCTNHHVTSRSHAPGGMPLLIRLGTAGALSAPSGEAPLERPAPCTGAFCSGNPAPPLPTIPPVPPRSGEQWAISLITRVTPGLGAFACTPGDASLQPLFDPSSIFHPPRAIAPSSTF